MSNLGVEDKRVLDALAAAGWSEDDRECAATALLCAASGEAGHWPTAAGWLATTAHALAEALAKGGAEGDEGA